MVAHHYELPTSEDVREGFIRLTFEERQRQNAYSNRMREQMQYLDPHRKGVVNVTDRKPNIVEERVIQRVIGLNRSPSISALTEVLPKGIRIIISSQEGVMEFEPSRSKDGYIDDFHKMLDTRD